MSASLLADSGTLSGSISPNTTIWHDGIKQDGSIPNNLFQFFPNIGSQKISTSQDSLITEDGIQSSATQVSISEVGSRKISILEPSISQIGTSQISPSQLSTYQTTASKIGIGEIGTIQTAISQSGITQISIAQDNTFHIECSKSTIAKIDPSKVATKFDIIYGESSKITLPSSISFAQFSNTNLTNHDLTPLLNSIYISTNIREEQPIQLSATATTAANNTLII